MKRQTRLRWLIVLVVVAVTLGIASPPFQQANAAALCSCTDCYKSIMNCIDWPSSSECNGDVDCCASVYYTCQRYCCRT